MEFNDEAGNVVIPVFLSLLSQSTGRPTLWPL